MCFLKDKEQIMEQETMECNICQKRLNSWDRRLSKTLAYKIPVCETCIAKEYGMDTDELRGRMERFFDIRPCIGI